jgi:hypothetical protein
MMEGQLRKCVRVGRKEEGEWEDLDGGGGKILNIIYGRWRQKAVGRVVWAFVFKVAKFVGEPYLW